MKKILLKLKELYMKIFKTKKRGSMFEFPNVKVKILEDKIELTKNAQTDGKLNEPKSNSIANNEPSLMISSKVSSIKSHIYQLQKKIFVFFVFFQWSWADCFLSFFFMAVFCLYLFYNS